MTAFQRFRTGAERRAAGFCLLLCLIVWPSSSSGAVPPKLPVVRPEEAAVCLSRLADVDRAVEEGLEKRSMPGCVVLIGRRGKVAFLRAYGDRQVKPSRVPMTADTLFDLASLTKPVATATSVMILMEQGKLCLQDAVAKVIPEFAQNGKERITLFQLLTHQGGLIPDNSLSDYADGPERAWQRIFAMKPREAPGAKFIYTDMGYIVLAELVRRATGKNVHEFSRDHVFRPLGMSETGFLPPEELRRRAAPTEQRDGHWMQGEVHDPRAFRLGGVAGHAGLFSTAADLAVYAQMLLAKGEYHGVRILAAQTVAEMTKPYPVSAGLRGLGWDVKTGYSSNRSPAYSSRAFGHGGFTGTSMWIDPQRELFVIFLSNRLHPDGKGSVNPLAARIGAIAVEAIQDLPKRTPPTAGKDRPAESEGVGSLFPCRPQRRSVGGSARGADMEKDSRPLVLTGIDALQRDGFALLSGRRVGLITNHTGVNRQGVSTARLLKEAPGVTLVALFSPEHGFQGKLDVAHVADTRDPATGLVVRSLYGKTRRPTAEMLQGIDTLVFDIQDIGTRFYTYISTMGYAMQAAAEHKLRFVVLDRPNPINGVDVEGPMLDAGRESFVGFHRLPVRHGMTIGELARLFNAELRLGLDLHVVRVEGWRRSDYFDATGLAWINPSPNMRSLTEAILYPGIGLLETTNLSVGRGTETPFEVIGAPWLEGKRLAEELSRAGLPGIRFTAVEFTPDASVFQQQRCGGIRMEIADRAALRPVRAGLEIARRLRAAYPDIWKIDAYDRLLANRAVLEALRAGKTVAEIEALYRPAVEDFLKRRAAFLLYE